MEQNLETRNCIETIDILKKHGFIEYTKNANPEHYKKLLIEKEYKPTSMKRYLKNGNIHIIFDYETFQFSYLSPAILYHINENIPINQIASILFFATINSKQKTMLRKKINDDYKIVYLYEYLKDFKNLDNSKFGKEINYMSHLYDIVEHIREQLILGN